MYHSLTFGDSLEAGKNTWDDWRLIPTSRPVFAFPEVKTHQVDIPGGNGVIELTSALTGYPTYNNRKGSWEFIVMHSGLTSDANAHAYDNSSKIAWQLVMSDIANYLHGQSMYISYEDDPDFYYKGRLSIGGWNNGEEYSTITIEYDLEPFKYSITDNSNQWKWDTFRFSDGVIKTYSGISYDGNGFTTEIYGTVTPVIPTISCNRPSTLTISKNGNGRIYNLAVGQHEYDDIVIYPGKNVWTFYTTDKSSGNANVYFRARSF